MVVDLRSDTVTRPSPGMRKAMANAEVGDDVFGEDPTVNLLQEEMAELLGKERGLFVSSGMMGNQLAIKSHTQPGNEVIVERHCHIYNYESGVPAFLSGVQLLPLSGVRGILTAEQIEAEIRPKNIHHPQSVLLSLENTHNRAGGTIFPLEEIKCIRQIADRYGLLMHLDGARLWNASVATSISLAIYGSYFDSVTVCFSKGLGAPVGSMLVGNHQFIERAHRYRKMVGGGMRQVGVLAAAARFAVKHHFNRLIEDHQKAQMFAKALQDLDCFSVDLEAVQTNIIFIKVQHKKYSASHVVDLLKKEDVLLFATAPNTLRAVTHLDVSFEGIKHAIQAFQRFC